MNVFVDDTNDLISIKEASDWATNYLKKNVSTANISYLIQYGRVKKNGDNGLTQISRNDLLNYYKSYNGQRELNWKNQLGEDLNWALSFDQYKEAETTKHVHRLHPYKGKFIPQLVEYFLDSHTDNFKKQSYFQKNDIILDPFSGSGTTMIQASELGMHAIGIDISIFNALIANCKIMKYDLFELNAQIKNISIAISKIRNNSNIVEFENELMKALYNFNNKYFPVPEYKYKLKQGLINEEKYGKEKEIEFLPLYNSLVKKYNIKLKQNTNTTFLDKWYSEHIRLEIDSAYHLIKKIKDENLRNLLYVILSRTIRSCRATTHADLATLIEPIVSAYYCSKHGKICKPLFSIYKWWETYSKDTVDRIIEFNSLRTNTEQICLIGDSRSIDIFGELEQNNKLLAEITRKKKINGIFSSPPYVGLIDYHEQHAYAYDLFEFKRNDDFEIGPLFKGQGREAKENYLKGISETLLNCKKYLIKNYDIFLVANDKYNLYPMIAENTGMKIVNKYTRPVLNRTEKDKRAYSEIIFHLKEK